MKGRFQSDEVLASHLPRSPLTHSSQPQGTETVAELGLKAEMSPAAENREEIEKLESPAHLEVRYEDKRDPAALLLMIPVF